MRSERMYLDANALGLSAGIVAAVLYTLCALAIAVAPGPAIGAMSLLHLGATGITHSVTWGGYFAGLLWWGIGTWLVFVALGGLYNRLSSRHEAARGVGVPEHRIA